MAAVGVGAGAFGAHALKDRLSTLDLAVYETAVRYWMYHALGICIAALVMSRIENFYIKASAVLMIFGSTIFSGSLVALVLSQIRTLGMITPIGGVLLILSWLLIVIGVLTH